jgi:hypothetical protein
MLHSSETFPPGTAPVSVTNNNSYFHIEPPVGSFSRPAFNSLWFDYGSVTSRRQAGLFATAGIISINKSGRFINLTY